jgi:hypothetical protein
MARPRPLRRIYLLCSFALLVVGAGAACLRHDDCALFDYCPDSLMTHAKALAGSMADECEACLNGAYAPGKPGCRTELSDCNASKECIYASQCMLSHSPRDFQHCLFNFYKNGFTRGDEERRPWESNENTFARCVMSQCRNECVEKPFACTEEPMEYAKPTLRAAVRAYPDFNRATGVTLRACGPKKCSQSHTTDDAGIAVVDDLPVGIPEDGLYFEIDPIEKERGRDAVPFTRYYPSRLGSDEEQLVAVYIVTSDEIGRGNALLGQIGVVLEDAGQSLILPDSCVWDEISAKGLSIHVDGQTVVQCHQLGRKPCDDAGVCTPCVWYSRGTWPTLDEKQTDGSGGGIVGLGDGMVTIHIEREDRVEIARRTIRMEPGTMTIARTWPLPVSEQRVRSSGTDENTSRREPSSR